jgi:Multiubiquitin
VVDNAEPPNTDRTGTKVTVNGKPLTFHDPLVDGRKVLHKAGFDPASDHVLIQLLRPGSVSRGIDEGIDLSKPGHYEFRAFAFDRVLNFTVEERGYEWGAAKISVDDLYGITGVDRHKLFILERGDEPDEILEEDGELDLDARGVEHVRTGKRLVTVTYNHNAFELERRVYTTEELHAAFAVTSGYVLDLILPTGEFRELKPGAKLKVRNGMEFVSHAPSGQSS